MTQNTNILSSLLSLEQNVLSDVGQYIEYSLAIAQHIEESILIV